MEKTNSGQSIGFVEYENIGLNFGRNILRLLIKVITQFFLFDFNYNNIGNAWNQWVFCMWDNMKVLGKRKKPKEPKNNDDINILSQLKKWLQIFLKTILKLVRLQNWGRSLIIFEELSKV